MAGGNHPRGEPQIDVVLVDLAGLEERGAIEAVAETRPHDAVLDALCSPVRIDVLHHDIPVRVLPLSGRPECRGHWSSDLQKGDPGPGLQFCNSRADWFRGSPRRLKLQKC